MIDQGKLSTNLISIVTLIFAALLSYLLNNPTALNQILEQLGVNNTIIIIVAPMLLAVVAVIYNYIKPRNPEPIDGA